MFLRYRSLIALLLLIILLGGIGAGCDRQSPPATTPTVGDPETTLRDYLQKLKEGDFPAAYKLLAQPTQAWFSAEDFQLHHQLMREFMEYKSFHLVKQGEMDSFPLEGRTYTRVAEFEVTDNIIDLANGNQLNSYSYKRMMVYENESWKVYRAVEKPAELLSDDYYQLGYMHQEGKGRSQNLQTASAYYDKAVGLNPQSVRPCIGLGFICGEQRKYEESNQWYQKSLALLEKDQNADKKWISGLTYNIAVNYQQLNNKSKAREYLQKALQIDPQNEPAQLLLLQLQS